MPEIINPEPSFWSSQLFAVIIGAVLTLISTLLIKKEEYSSSLDKEIALEQMSAYRSMYSLICILNNYLVDRSNVHLPKDCHLAYIECNDQEYHRSFQFPSVFLDFDSFFEYKQNFSKVLNNNRLFLDQKTLNKLSFLDSYLGTIFIICNNKNVRYLRLMGFVLSNEIGNLCNEIELDIQDFLYSKKRKFEKSNFSLNFEYEYAQRKNTLLYNYFINTDETPEFGTFPLCYNCSHQKSCPLRDINSEASTNQST